MSGKHEGFWMDVDGEPAHFLADPDMMPETQEALMELVRAARRYMDEQDRAGEPTGHTQEKITQLLAEVRREMDYQCAVCGDTATDERENRPVCPSHRAMIDSGNTFEEVLAEYEYQLEHADDNWEEED